MHRVCIDIIFSCIDELFVAPSIPRFLNITASTETSVTLSWLPPDPPNGPLSIYEVVYTEEGVPTTARHSLLFSTMIRITPLQPDVVYVVSVNASTRREDNRVIFGPAAIIRIMNGT